MAIKPISCGISNINLQTVGKTGQLEQGIVQEDPQLHRRGQGLAPWCACGQGSGDAQLEGLLPSFTASVVRMTTRDTHAGEGQRKLSGLLQTGSDDLS